MFELHFGEIPLGIYVCHRCDNPKCINPEHLFLGTPKDNMNDKMKKGRNFNVKGSQHGQAKLDEEKVLEIKRLLAEKNLTQKKIGEKYGVNQNTISLIKSGKIWSHVENQPTQITNTTNNITYNAPVTKNITVNGSECYQKQLNLFDTDKFN
jgi:predicted XRE-type DNA-binding protein